MRALPGRLPLLALLIPLGYLPGYLAGSRPDGIGSAALVGATLLAWLILDAGSESKAPWEKPGVAGLPGGDPPRRPHPRLWAALAATALLQATAVTLGAAARVEALGRKEAFSVGIFQQALWYTVRGVPLGATYSTIDGSLHSQFGIHFSPLLLALAPLYALRPEASTLLALQALALAAAVWPLTALARRALGAAGAALVGLVWLVHPTVIGAPLNGFHDMSFAPFFLFGAAWALEGRRFRLYLLALAGLAGVREDLAFTVVLFGGLALWRRAPRAFVVAPVALGAAWLIVSLGWILPAHRTPELLAHPAVFFRQYLGSLGETPGAVVGHLLTHPWEVVRRVLSREGMLYLLAVLRPLGLLLPIPDPAWLVALQPLALNLLSDGGALRSPMARYTLPVVAALFLALPRALRFWVDRLEPGWNPTRATGSGFRLPRRGLAPATRLAALALISGVLSFYFNRLDQQFLARPRADLARQREIVALIPREGAVLAPDWAYARLANRARFACIGSIESRALDTGLLGGFDYVMVDLSQESFEARRYPELLPTLLDNLLLNNNFERLNPSGPIYLFRRRPADSPSTPDETGR